MFEWFRNKPREINVKIVVEDVDEWKEEDAYTLNIFLRSPAGRKLMHKLNFSMYQIGLDGEGRKDLIKGMALMIDNINQFSVIHPKIDEDVEVQSIEDLNVRPWF